MAERELEIARELLRRPGQMKLLQRDVPAPEGFGLDMIGVPTGEPIHLDLDEGEPGDLARRLENGLLGAGPSGAGRR